MSTEHQAAAGVAIEAMRQRGRPGQAETQRIERRVERGAAAGAGVHLDARRLVDNQHQAVAVEHAPRQRGGDQRQRYRRINPVTRLVLRFDGHLAYGNAQSALSCKALIEGVEGLMFRLPADAVEPEFVALYDYWRGKCRDGRLPGRRRHRSARPAALDAA